VGLGAARRGLDGGGVRAAADGLHGSPVAAASDGGAPASVGGDGAAPIVRLPRLTENGAKVPVVVEIDHPMDAAHHVTCVTVENPRDPVPSKGEFRFTAGSGRAYVSFQARLDDGASTLGAAVECSAGRRWWGRESTRVVDGAGGCGGSAPPPARTAQEIRPPVIRLPQLVRGERLQPGRVIDVQVKMLHPVRTGLERRGDAWAQVGDAFYLTDMEVFLGAERVSHFRLTPALSDNPLIGFRLRPREEGLLRVLVRNNRGARLEAEHPILFA
jgi:sulfur-oxidizing protein SoxY